MRMFVALFSHASMDELSLFEILFAYHACHTTNKQYSVPMKRLGTIEEVVKSVSYLLSDDSSYTTGTNLVVDGGLSSGLKA